MRFTIYCKKKKFRKSKNCDFSKGVSPWSWSKIGHFSKLFLKAIQERKMCFLIFQNEKTAFQAIKRRSSKTGKIAIFPKGKKPPWFLSKIGRFYKFFLKAIYERKMCFTILQNAKRPFQAIKTRSSKSHFSKAIFPWFLSKIGHFFIFFFRKYRPEKCVLRYSRTKKRVSRL